MLNFGNFLHFTDYWLMTFLKKQCPLVAILNDKTKPKLTFEE